MLVERIKVVAGAAVTWLVAASVMITIFSEEIGGLLNNDTAAAFASWATTAVGWLGAAVAIIRRVTPVLPEERGVLPVSEG